MNLRNYQGLAAAACADAWKEHDRVLVSMATGCHAAGQGILMFDGTIKPVEKIKVGDLLMGASGQPRKVLRLIRGNGELVRICPVKGKPWIVNRDHVLSLQRTKQRTVPKRKTDLLYGEIIDVSVRQWEGWTKNRKHIFKLFRAPADFGRKQNLKLDPYFLGVLLGDGGLSQRGVNVTTADPEIVDMLKEQARHYFVKLRRRKAGGKSETFYFAGVTGRGRSHRNYLLDVIRAQGLSGKCSGDKEIPQAYKLASKECRLAVLAGLIDTDGSLSHGCYDYVSKSHQLASDVTFVARSVGLAAYIVPVRKTCTNTMATGDYWRVCISGDLDTVPCRIPHKQAAPRKQKKNVLRTGFHVEPAGNGKFFGFTLDGDGRYLLDDFTVTHNSGKTIMGAAIVDWWRDFGPSFDLPNRVLWLAHRDELIWQAAKSIELATGEDVAIEKGESRARSASMFDRRVVVGSIQSFFSEDRRAAFGEDEFGLVVCDEAHHYVAEGFRDVLSHFQSSKVLGMTATTDRLDQVSLGQLFETCAYHYDIVEAINDGWLCKLRQEFVTIEGLDWSTVRKTGSGDLSEKDIDRVINEEGVLHQVVAGFVPLAGNRQTIVFTPSVSSARDIAALITRYTKRDNAACISGATPPEERRQIIDAYRMGHYQFLVNCQVLTEGFDAPATSCIVIARPTNSRMLYAQMIGRGMRGGANVPIEGKEDCLVIDLVGASTKHQLTNTAAVLAGDYYHEVVLDEANRLIEDDLDDHEEGDEAPDILEALIEAAATEEELRRKQRAGIIAKAKMNRKTVDPFGLLDLEPVTIGPVFWESEVPTKEQLDRLDKAGIASEGLTKYEAATLCREIGRRVEEGLCSFKMARHLRTRGFDPNMTMGQAGFMMEWLGDRPGGWTLGVPDFKRRAHTKKRGSLVSFEELDWTPRWCVREDVAVTIRPIGAEEWQVHTTTKRTFYHTGHCADGSVLVEKDGWEMRVDEDMAEALK